MNFKKIVIFTLILLLGVPGMVFADTKVTDSELASDSIGTLASTDTISFVMTLQWGFVRGNPGRDNTEKNYAGSVIGPNEENTRVSLIKTLLFEQNDLVSSRANPASWNSKIFGHWDGAMIEVRSKANETITVSTAKGNIAKTASEWYGSNDPVIVDYGNNELLVIKIHPHKRLRRSAFIWWGVKNSPHSPADDSDIITSGFPKIDFSGSLTMDNGSFVKLRKALRLERNDSEDEHDRNHVVWTSSITTGRDGMAVLFVPDRNSDIEDGFTISFPNLSPPFEKHYSFDQLQGGVRDTVTIGDTEYVIVVGQKYIAKKLYRSLRNRRLFYVEDNISHEVLSTEVLEANWMSESDAVEVDDEVLLAFEQGDPLDYPNGTILEEGNVRYIITNGFRRKLTSDVAAARIRTNRLHKVLDEARARRLQQGPDITSDDEFPDDSLVTVEGDSAVWRIRGGKRQVYSHARVFFQHHRNFDHVRAITLDKLREYDWAPPVEYGEGTLVKVPT